MIKRWVRKRNGKNREEKKEENGKKKKEAMTSE